MWGVAWFSFSFRGFLVCIRDWTRDYRGAVGSATQILSESDQRTGQLPLLWRTHFNFHHLQKRQVALNYSLRGKTQTTAPDLEYAMLCAACTKIYDSSVKQPHEILYNSYTHHQSAAEIEQYGASGCYICSTLWDRFTDEEKERIRANTHENVQQASFVQTLLDLVRDTTWKLLSMFLFRYLLPPLAKQFMEKTDHNCYGWQLYVDPVGEGVARVRFYFGIPTWKIASFLILPCRGSCCTQSSIK